MSEDIVDQLRFHQKTNGFDGEASALVDKAIAEIDLLRRQAKWLRAVFDHGMSGADYHAIGNEFGWHED